MCRSYKYQDIRGRSFDVVLACGDRFGTLRFSVVHFVRSRAHKMNNNKDELPLCRRRKWHVKCNRVSLEDIWYGAACAGQDGGGQARMAVSSPCASEIAARSSSRRWAISST